MTAWLAAHHYQLAYALGLLLTLLNIAIKVALYIHPISDWVAIAEKRPRFAALIRLLLAVGIDPVRALQAGVDLARGSASPGALAETKALGVTLSKPLIVSAKDLKP